MSAHQALYPICTMASVLKVSASGYYAWRSRPVSARASADADLTRRIRDPRRVAWNLWRPACSWPKLKADSLSVGRKRIARLMRAAGVAGVSRRRSAPVTTRQTRDHHPASDLVRRNFMAERPNALWVADITFLPTLAGFLYSRSFSTPGRAGSSDGPSRPI
jgi:putative transposase